MNPQETFVTRLRRQRLRARVSIEQIADTLRIKPAIIAAFEANDLSEWPKGLYSRAWVRAYALAVDLDPVDTVDEFCRLFPQGDRRSGGTIQEIAAIVASPSDTATNSAIPRDGVLLTRSLRRRRRRGMPSSRSQAARCGRV